MSTEREKEAIADNHLFSLHNMLQKKGGKALLLSDLAFAACIYAWVYILEVSQAGGPHSCRL